MASQNPITPTGVELLKGGRARFTVWAPRCSEVHVELIRKSAPEAIPLKKGKNGYFSAVIPEVMAGDRYWYMIDRVKRRPDPASRFQPDGVHGPSQMMDPDAFRWTDRRWKGLPLKTYVIYELHTGTFTKQGTFDSAVQKLDHLQSLGVRCVELMPVHQFPGKHNWGYDGVDLFAVQNTYGGPDGLKRFVNACHRRGMAVCLDVVYNHFGPEGNYLHDFGPYFTQKYRTPWGEAIRYDEAGSAPVRSFFIQNALYWIREFHIDALRLDAVHSIFDKSPKNILEEIKDAVTREGKRLGREVFVIAESESNDFRLVRSKRKGGMGLDAQWSDDFHHAVHAKITGENSGYYQDYGGMKDIAKAIESTFVYEGQYSRFRQRRYGTRVREIPAEKFVINIQNHDQIGNRPWGDRLSSQIPYEVQKITAAVLLLNPHTPLIFMGQEYGETAPFRYFIDHGDRSLVDAVRRGRLNEFKSFGWKSIPDPKSLRTFDASKLRWERAKSKRGVYWSAAPRSRTCAAIFSFSNQKQDVTLPSSFKRFKVAFSTTSASRKGAVHQSSIRLPKQSALVGFLGR